MEGSSGLQVCLLEILVLRDLSCKAQTMSDFSPTPKISAQQQPRLRAIFQPRKKKKQSKGCLCSGDAKVLWHLWLGKTMLPCLLKQIYLRNSILFRDKGLVLPETSRAKTEVWIKKLLVCQEQPLVQGAQVTAGPHQLLSSRLPLPTAVLPFPASSKHISVHISSQTGGGEGNTQGSKKERLSWEQ